MEDKFKCTQRFIPPLVGIFLKMTTQTKISHASVQAMFLFMLKTQNMFPSSTHEILGFFVIFHAFYTHNHSNVLHRSCPLHAQIMRVHWHEHS